MFLEVPQQNRMCMIAITEVFGRRLCLIIMEHNIEISITFWQHSYQMRMRLRNIGWPHNDSSILVIVLITFVSIASILLSQKHYVAVIILSCKMIVCIVCGKLYVTFRNFRFLDEWRSERLVFEQQNNINNEFNNPITNVRQLRLLQSQLSCGLSQNQIELLPTIILAEASEERCSICLQSQNINDTIRTLPCLHQFHADCIDVWLSKRSNCPICKSEVNIPAIWWQCAYIRFIILCF